MGLPLFIEQIPTYECRDGRMHITIGEMCLAMPVDVFLIGCTKGKLAVAEWQRQNLREANILPFPKSEESRDTA